MLQRWNILNCRPGIQIFVTSCSNITSKWYFLITVVCIQQVGWNLSINVWMINRLKLHLNGKKLKGTVSINEKWNVQNNTGGNNHNLPRYLKLFFYRIPNPLKGYLILSTNILWLRTNILFLSCPNIAFWSCRAEWEYSFLLL